MSIVLFCCVLFLAYSNGANDNFKGVATLFGTQEVSFIFAKWITTIATGLGLLAGLFFAEGLMKAFSGKGLVPDELVNSIPFMVAVALSAGITVIIATRFGMPVSTTHALIGGLIGAGCNANFSEVNFAELGKTFVLPLILSPIIACTLGFVLNKIIPTHQKWNASIRKPFHIFFASAVCLARGLNDGPKIAGMLLVLQLSNMNAVVAAIAVVMLVGGWLNASKIAETMSLKLAKIEPEMGTVTSAVTSSLVVTASLFALPVSTTHVAVGSIFGSALTSKTQNYNVIKDILLSWILTMPIAALISYISYFCLSIIR